MFKRNLDTITLDALETAIVKVLFCAVHVLVFSQATYPDEAPPKTKHIATLLQECKSHVISLPFCCKHFYLFRIITTSMNHLAGSVQATPQTLTHDLGDF